MLEEVVQYFSDSAKKLDCLNRKELEILFEAIETRYHAGFENEEVQHQLQGAPLLKSMLVGVRCDCYANDRCYRDLCHV